MRTNLISWGLVVPFVLATPASSAHALRPMPDEAGLEERLGEINSKEQPDTGAEEPGLDQIQNLATRQILELFLRLFSGKLSEMGHGKITEKQVLGWMRRQMILDLGAGLNFEFLHWIRERGARSAYGLDRKFPDGIQDRLGFLREGSFERKWPFESDQFSFILSTFALNPEEAPLGVSLPEYYSRVAEQMNRHMASMGLAVLAVGGSYVVEMETAFKDKHLFIENGIGRLYWVTREPLRTVLDRIAREIAGAPRAGLEEDQAEALDSSVDQKERIVPLATLHVADVVPNTENLHLEQVGYQRKIQQVWNVLREVLISPTGKKITQAYQQLHIPEQMSINIFQHLPQKDWDSAELSFDLAEEVPRVRVSPTSAWHLRITYRDRNREKWKVPINEGVTVRGKTSKPEWMGGGNGLKNIRERTLAAGGWMTVEGRDSDGQRRRWSFMSRTDTQSADLAEDLERGTEIVVSIPIQPLEGITLEQAAAKIHSRLPAAGLEEGQAGALGSFEDQTPPVQQVWVKELGRSLEVPQGIFSPDHRLSETFVRFILENKELFQGKRYLEIGIGSGNIVIALLRAGATVVGVDVVPEAVEAARRNVLEEFGPEVFDQQRVKLGISDVYDGLSAITGEDHPQFDGLIFDNPIFPFDPVPGNPLTYAAYSGKNHSTLRRMLAGLREFVPIGPAYLLATQMVPMKGAVITREEYRSLKREWRKRAWTSSHLRREASRLGGTVKPMEGYQIGMPSLGFGVRNTLGIYRLSPPAGSLTGLEEVMEPKLPIPAAQAEETARTAAEEAAAVAAEL